jgi:hypothetical protein
MGDMGGRHLGRQTGARLHLGQFALGLLQLRDGGLQPAVGAGQFFGMRQELVAQDLGPAAQQLLLPFHFGDVGIDGHPAPVGQRRALDRDRAPVGAAAFHVVGHEGARGLHPVAHEGGDIVDIAVLARIHEVADGLLELRTGGDEMLGQAEHRLKRAVADRQPKVCVIDRQGLLDQVQARAGQMTRATAMSHCATSLTAPLRSDALPAVAVKRGHAPVTIRKDLEKVRQNLT